MKPSPGNPRLYTIYDYFTGLTIHSKRLKSESKRNIIKFLKTAKKRINKELGVSIIGIISDALPAQRKAIEEVFPNVLHCLCHYHFYKFVFDAPKKLDSNLMAHTRKFLANLYYLRKSTLYANQGKVWGPKFSLTQEILETLRNLSKWKPRPKDPYFVGLELFTRLMGVYFILDAFIEGLDGCKVQFEDEKVILNLQLKIKEFIETKKDVAAEFEIIKEYLAEIKAILDNSDSSAEEALKELENHLKKLVKRLLSGSCMEI